MSSEVSGIPLRKFEAPIHDALTRYGEDSKGDVEFDLDAARRLELTDGSRYHAISSSPVKYLGETVGKLAVVIFAPGDGTGDEKTLSLSVLADTWPYPREPRVVPRSKAAMHTETHLTISSHLVDSPNADPIMFAGSLDLIAEDAIREGRFLYKLASLGIDSDVHTRQMALGGRNWTPRSTATVGYLKADNPLYVGAEACEDLRFGDPHAVYNATDDVQVAAFFGISPESAATNFDVFAALWTKVPFLHLSTEPNL